METLNHYMTERSLPRSLQVSIRKHYRYFWSRRTVFEHEEEILSNLSTPLRADLLRFMYRDVIRRIPLFEVLSSAATLRLQYDTPPVWILCLPPNFSRILRSAPT